MRYVAGVGLLAAASLAFAQAGSEVQTLWRCVDPAGKTHFTSLFATLYKFLECHSTQLQV